jgi:hypothetical protein
MRAQIVEGFVKITECQSEVSPAKAESRPPGLQDPAGRLVQLINSVPDLLRDAVYANRRRIRGRRGRRLLRQRGEYLERPFAHAYETGGLRRVYLRGHCNILKRVLIHLGALNLALLMRVLLGVGTPRSLQGRVCALFLRLVILWRRLATVQLPAMVCVRDSSAVILVTLPVLRT